MRTRTTLDRAGSGVRRFNSWLRDKLSESDETTGRKKYRQREVAEYIGITQPMLSERMAGKSEWTLKQACSAADYFGVSMEEVFK